MSSDPAGFPDGPNGHFYAPVPTSGVDPLGLKEVLIALYENETSGYDLKFSNLFAGSLSLVGGAVGVLASSGLLPFTGGASSAGIAASLLPLLGGAGIIYEGLTYVPPTKSFRELRGPVSDSAVLVDVSTMALPETSSITSVGFGATHTIQVRFTKTEATFYTWE